jgi:hypothetical protein
LEPLALPQIPRITAEDGYVHQDWFWQQRDADQDPESHRDYEGVAWVCLDQMLGHLEGPPFGHLEGPPFREESPETEALYNEWPLWRRDFEARVTANHAAAKRLAPLLERNREVIIEGSEQVDWW